LADVSDGAVRDLAAQILSRPEFASARPSASDKWFASLLQHIIEWLNQLLGLHDSAPGLYWLVLIASFLIFALLVAHIAWTISIALRAPIPAPTPPFKEDSANPIADAERMAAAGSYLEAAHLLMIASFRTLAERFVIELQPDRSNLWIRRALQGSNLEKRLAQRVIELIERTERHWFGDRDSKSEIYTEWRAAFDELAQAITK